MKRSTVAFLAVVLVIFGSVFAVGGPAGAQDDDAEATISALQTEVADQHATSQARGDRINAQKTQIAELRDRIDELELLVPTPTPNDVLAQFSGSTTTATDGFFLTAGQYRVEATVLSSDGNTIFFVYIHGPNGLEESVFIERADDRGRWTASAVLVVPVDGEHFFNVECDDPWELSVKPL